MNRWLPVAAMLALAARGALASDHDEHDEDHDEHDEDHDDEVSKSDAWLYSMVAVFVVSFLSLVGVVFVSLRTEMASKLVIPLIGLSAGTLLGNSFFTLLPETTELVGFDLDVSCVVFAGVAFGFITERVFHTHPHVHEDGVGHEHNHGGVPMTATGGAVGEAEQRSPEASSSADNLESGSDDGNGGVTAAEAERIAKERRHLAMLSLSGDVVHNFVDGALIAATFLSSKSTGITTTIAIALHELPQEMGDFCVLRHAGFSPRKALLANFAVSLSAVAGGVVTLLLDNDEDFEEVTNYMLPFAAGLFIYLALANLLPEINKVKDRRQHLAAIGMAVLGVGLMALLILMPHDHEHGHGDDDHGDH